ncbi:hypothetical protein CMV_016692 [Castanea mollissima]|uniref:Protein kinase domain-containing protein n=1 Tax=Castanea mollissima TaxID=60419 RepID=A0A8J4QS78_9ROSI|nr:hypothetical protein CMV_016692 [Castanea mollissima]
MGGQDLYIRVAASELDHIEKNKHFGQKYQAIIIVCSAILLTAMLALRLVTYVRRMKLRKEGMNIIRQNDYNNEDKKEDMELPIFDLITISNATDNFASNNKLGEGGFGSVYKGTLLGGQEIAKVFRGIIMKLYETKCFMESQYVEDLAYSLQTIAYYSVGQEAKSVKS